MPTTITQAIDHMGRTARAASHELASLSPDKKNRALQHMAEVFDANRKRIQTENFRDLQAGRESNLGQAMLDRLHITDQRISGMIQGLLEIVALPDPVGEVESMTTRPNGLRVGRVRAPIGVIGIIYESRPNVTVDAGALCIKSGNAVILRGGSEAIHSNVVLAGLMSVACREAGLPAGAVQLVPTTDREAVGAMLRADRHIDIIIPRGGKNLIRRVVEESTIPVIKHLDGNCTVYIDEGADLKMGTEIIVNSKVQRPGVCNAAETMLVHSALAGEFLPRALAELQARGVEVRGCERTRLHGQGILPASDEDWDAEYLDLILAVKVVDSLDEAIEFINAHGSHHTESIVSRDYGRIQAFTRRVDSACVHVNCSTRFSDGGEYGLGAEIGISTDKLHARGPMGLRELTTIKWVVLGEGQIRT
ncbi:glutamate-5-semialdehyde dehydrogenase [Candidatus Poribacteria bacterium]|nr:glutamate-5-semialdehyde dehydrogenase [Candidatus Poribacteria bacterium]